MESFSLRASILETRTTILCNQCAFKILRAKIKTVKKFQVHKGGYLIEWISQNQLAMRAARLFYKGRESS